MGCEANDGDDGSDYGRRVNLSFKEKCRRQDWESNPRCMIRNQELRSLDQADDSFPRIYEG